MPGADFLVLTPLDQEWSAFHQVARPARQKQPAHSINTITYYLWRRPVNLPSGVHGCYLVVGAPISRKTPGLAYTASFVSKALASWEPRRIILLGIAGNLNKNAVQLGDVVVSDAVHGYEVADAEKSVSYRTDLNHTSTLLIDRVRAFQEDGAAYGKWQHSCSADARKRGLVLARAPRLHIGPVASGNTVVKRVWFANALKKLLTPDLLAVEMEAHGMYAALRQHDGGIDPFMIRGISDNADSQKSSLEAKSKQEWRTFATTNAARLFAMLLDRGPVEPSFADIQVSLSHHGLAPFRARGVPIDSALLVTDTQNLSFSDFLRLDGPTPELFVDVSATDGSGRTVLPEKAVCMVGSTQRKTVWPSKLSGEAIRFTLPPSGPGLKAELLLAFPEVMKEVSVHCHDSFGRSAVGIFNSPGRR